MREIKPLQTFQQIKLLADPRRMRILRLLMSEPATLSQLAQTLEQSPAWVRHHIQQLETANLVEIAEIRKSGTITEKYYRSKADAFLLQEMILPESKKAALIFSGSHDLGLEIVASAIEPYVHVLSLPVGSLNGLINLRQGLCQVSGAHLLDETGEYNTAYVQRIFPDRDMELVTLAHRRQGLIVASGNPKGVRSLSDLPRSDLHFINRNAGSGTRLWFDAELKKEGIPANQISGYGDTLTTHSAAACAVASGQADVALGLEAAAKKYALDFIPLFNERYDLVFSSQETEKLDVLLNYIQTANFRRQLAGLTGYESANTGDHISLAI